MSNKNNYRLSDLAKQDIQSIFEYTIENWGEKQARVYALKLSDGFDLIAQSPKVGTSRNKLYPNALSYIVGSHIIFYAINSDSNIEIARVLHQSMDFERHF